MNVLEVVGHLANLAILIGAIVYLVECFSSK
jgi:hypothetical protein